VVCYPLPRHLRGCYPLPERSTVTFFLVTLYPRGLPSLFFSLPLTPCEVFRGLFTTLNPKFSCSLRSPNPMKPQIFLLTSLAQQPQSVLLASFAHTSNPKFSCSHLSRSPNLQNFLVRTIHQPPKFPFSLRSHTTKQKCSCSLLSRTSVNAKLSYSLSPPHPTTKILLLALLAQSTNPPNSLARFASHNPPKPQMFLVSSHAQVNNPKLSCSLRTHPKPQPGLFGPLAPSKPHLFLLASFAQSTHS
jgi:hypothetical protein